MFTIYDEATDAVYGTLDETQLQFLMDHLEEESAEDTDFYINQATVDMLEQDGADAGLLTLLRTALGGREDMDIRWAKAERMRLARAGRIRFLQRLLRQRNCILAAPLWVCSPRVDRCILHLSLEARFGFEQASWYAIMASRVPGQGPYIIQTKGESYATSNYCREEAPVRRHPPGASWPESPPFSRGFMPCRHWGSFPMPSAR